MNKTTLIVLSVLAGYVIYLSIINSERYTRRNAGTITETTDQRKSLKEQQETGRREAEQIREMGAKREKDAEEEKLRTETLLFVSTPFDPLTCGSCEEIAMYVENYSRAAKLVRYYENSDSIAFTDFAKTLKAKLIAHQLKTFPVLRREYAKKLNSEFWQQGDSPLLNDVEVGVGGDRNQHAYFTWAGFQLNANVKNCQRVVSDKLRTLRFTQSRYCGFYKYEHEVAFSVYAGKDSDI